MAQVAARALAIDERTRAVLIVSKPPAAAPAREVLSECVDTPGVAVFLGLHDAAPPPGIQTAATLEAHHALSAGLHVLLFSDGVPVEQEIEL